ncbi:MAG: cytochrome c3 family protein, partial [Terriglobales bacterium]
MLYVFIFFVSPSWAADTPSNADCLACHDDRSLTTKRGANTVSLYVDGKKFASSVHSSLSCTSCHASLEGKELPHDTPVAKVICGTCHSGEAEQLAKSLHGKAAAHGDALA